LLSFGKWRPCSSSFTGPNRLPSEGAKSGLWTGWGRTVHYIFAIASRVHRLVWGWACFFSLSDISEAADSIWWHSQSWGLEMIRVQDVSTYCQGLENLILHYDRCLNKFEDYVEK
jgi:hypothetical protein